MVIRSEYAALTRSVVKPGCLIVITREANDVGASASENINQVIASTSNNKTQVNSTKPILLLKDLKADLIDMLRLFPLAA